MTWLPDGPCAFRRDDDRYMVNRAPEHGYPATYMLVKLGQKSGNIWIGSEIIATAHAADDGERKQAMDSLMEQCE